MSHAVESNLYLYADDSCLLFQHTEVTEIRTQLTKDFSNVYDWFLDNQISTHFEKDKTKPILFIFRGKLVEGLDVRYKETNIM